MNIIEELRWRGMIHNIVPETEEFLNKEKSTIYIGFDPTGASLHVGHLLPLTLLMRFQKAGHKPLAIIGGSTGRVGDPTDKAAERALLNDEQIQNYIAGIQAQMEKLLDFDCGDLSAEILDNYSWTKDWSFLDFIRDIGKHISVNYMAAKDSVKKRMETGISFTEFSYQLLQGYDFLWLYQNKNCKVQAGGSDQWGNITTGTELVRRIAKGKAYAFTCPLITKPDGSKFGKSEAGESVWLNPSMTSPYKFYQFWLNTSDEGAANYMRMFTFLSKDEIEKLISEHTENPGMRSLQKKLAWEVTTMVHDEGATHTAIKASNILFGKSTKEDLNTLDEATLLDIFDGVPQFNIEKSGLAKGIPIADFLTETTSIIQSKGEVRRALKENSLSINKEKFGQEERNIDASDLLNDKYILMQRGKKKYFLVIAE